MDLTDKPSLSASVGIWLRAWAPALVIGTALATVVGTTGFVSYTHISALTLQTHQSWKTAHLTPLFIDGQIVIGSVFYMAVPSRSRWWGMLGVVPGLAESLYANWQSGIVYGRSDAAWATVAAQAFAVSSFLFERWLKTQVGKGTKGGPGTVAQAPAGTPGEGGASAGPEVSHPLSEVPSPRTPDVVLQELLESAPDPVLALLLGVSRNKVRAWRGRLDAAGDAEPEPGAPEAETEPDPIRYAALNGSAAGA